MRRGGEAAAGPRESGQGGGFGDAARIPPPASAAEFAVAVREALRNLHRPDLLVGNSLLGARLIAAAQRDPGSPATPTELLRGLLRSYQQRLGEAPEAALLKRVLELTFFKPLRSQQAVADALNMSWSTYRRRLAAAVQVLATEMWEAECALRAAEVHTVPVTGAAEPAERQRPPVRRGLRFVARRRIVLPLALMAAAGLGFAAWRLFHASPAGPGSSRAAAAPLTIAVLPFMNSSGNPGLQYVSDGVTDELINRLGRVPELRVAARTSAFAFRGKALDVRTIARALGVEYVLEGSVEDSGAELRVHVALINARDGYEMWSDEYSAGSSDLLKAEDGITDAVVEELPLGNAAALRGSPNEANPATGEAHDLYLVGLEYLNRRTAPDIRRAIGYFQSAVRGAPGYASAWSDIATAYAILRDYDSDAPPDSDYADALTAADRAVTLDPRLDRPHAVLGLLHEEHWEWASADRELRLALALDPSDPTAHQWYAMYLWFTGDMTGALGEMRTAHDLDPLSPIINTDLCRALLYAGDTDGALAQCRTAIALAPRFALAHLFLAEVYMSQARNADALREMRTAVELTPAPHPASYLSMLGLAFVLTGDDADARDDLETLQARARRHYVSGVSLAVLYWALGDEDHAFSELGRAASDHDHLMMPVVADRAAPWAADPRYAALLAKLHLSAAGPQTSSH